MRSPVTVVHLPERAAVDLSDELFHSAHKSVNSLLELLKHRLKAGLIAERVEEGIQAQPP